MKIWFQSLWLLFLICNVGFSQSLEFYSGNERIGVDLMWFKNFKNIENQNTPFLFFSRNRASVDYHNSPSLFGSVNAISYNFKNGVGIVSVASFVNNGFVAKAGIQYYKQKKDFMFFGWLVADIEKEGNIDLFGLFRYLPKISEKWSGFYQLELFPIYNPTLENWNITERLRIGLKHHALAGGIMLDLNQIGKYDFKTTHNLGGFLRYDF